MDDSTAVTILPTQPDLDQRAPATQLALPFDDIEELSYTLGRAAWQFHKASTPLTVGLIGRCCKGNKGRAFLIVAIRSLFGSKGWTDATNGQIAAMVGDSPHTVRKHIDAAVAGGLLAREVKGPFRRLGDGRFLIAAAEHAGAEWLGDRPAVTNGELGDRPTVTYMTAQRSPLEKGDSPRAAIGSESTTPTCETAGCAGVPNAMRNGGYFETCQACHRGLGPVAAPETPDQRRARESQREARLDAQAEAITMTPQEEWEARQ